MVPVIGRTDLEERRLEQWKKEVAYIAGESTSESKQVKASKRNQGFGIEGPTRGQRPGLNVRWIFSNALLLSPAEPILDLQWKSRLAT